MVRSETQETETWRDPSIFPAMKSMLVIDGSLTIARLFGEIFKKRGWSVAICGDRGSAIQRLIGNGSYDVILLSNNLSETTGVQMVDAIRKLERCKGTAVVMLTVDDSVSDDFLAAGADEVLLKPINPNALVWVVDKLVNRAQLACSAR